MTWLSPRAWKVTGDVEMRNRPDRMSRILTISEEIAYEGMARPRFSRVFAMIPLNASIMRLYRTYMASIFALYAASGRLPW